MANRISTVGTTALLLLTFPFRISSQSNAADPDDLSFIKKWAAIGDSYAAGIGAGNVLDNLCRRHDSAYPNLMNAQLGENTTDMDFTFIACSGAEIPAIADQANSLSDGQQMITISGGGNDAGLLEALNDCVFTFKTILFNGNCDQTLAKIQGVIDSNEFSSSADGLLRAAKAKLAPGGVM